MTEREKLVKAVARIVQAHSHLPNFQANSIAEAAIRTMTQKETE